MQPFSKLSTGDYMCNTCHAVFGDMQSVMDCSTKHNLTSADMATNLKSTMAQALGASSAQSSIDEYRDAMKSNDTLEVAKKLALSMLEDYAITREMEIQEKGRPSVLSMNFAKNATVIVTDLLKVTTPSASVNINVEAGKKSDLSALRNMIDRAQIIDVSDQKQKEEDVTATTDETREL